MVYLVLVYLSPVFIVMSSSENIYLDLTVYNTSTLKCLIKVLWSLILHNHSCVFRFYCVCLNLIYKQIDKVTSLFSYG